MKTSFKADPTNKGRGTVYNVRLAYAQDLITPRAMARDDGTPGVPRYGATILIPETDTDTLNAIQALMWAIAQEKFGAQAQGVWMEMQASGKLALKSGATKASKEGFLGNFFISASAKAERPPMLYHKYAGPDGKVQQLPRPNSVIYSGCYANVQLSFWAQNNGYGKRINADVVAVQFAGDGTAFAGSATGVDESAFSGEAAPDAFQVPPQAAPQFAPPQAAPAAPQAAPQFAPPAAAPAAPMQPSPPPAFGGNMGAFTPGAPFL